MTENIQYDEVKIEVEAGGYKLLTTSEDYDPRLPVTISDDGYLFDVEIRNILRYKKRNLVGRNNKYSIHNINQYLVNNKIPFSCISNEYVNYHSELEFVCHRCGEHIFADWHSINRNDSHNRHHIICSNCDGRTESIHALVLKQMFKHEYPDTIEEEKSCRNPVTGKILPTDIVNHRLKIAIEIQSQWHDFEDRKIIDSYKKKFWIDNGYSFYDPDIRDYTVLEICQIFFDIDELPEYINYEYSNKLNIRTIQKLLDDGFSVPKIESKLGVNRHRIYDALYSGKLSYPKNYQNSCYTSIIQLDENGNFVREFETIAEACNFYGIKKGRIDSALSRPSHYSQGSYWFRKDEFDPAKFQPGHKRSKFMIPVDKFDRDGNYIRTYNTIIEASKDCGVSNTQIYKVLLGKLNQTGGFVFKKAA